MSNCNQLNDGSNKQSIISEIMNDFDEDENNVYNKSILFNSFSSDGNKSGESELPKNETIVANDTAVLPEKLSKPDEAVSSTTVTNEPVAKKRKFFQKRSVPLPQQYRFNNNTLLMEDDEHANESNGNVGYKSTRIGSGGSGNGSFRNINDLTKRFTTTNNLDDCDSTSCNNNGGANSTAIVQQQAATAYATASSHSSAASAAQLSAVQSLSFSSDDDDSNAAANNKRVQIAGVKSYHEMLEIGEFEEFNYDIGYAVDGIQSETLSIRCLSILNLASKCLIPSFRMHLRAYGNLSKIFKMLYDSSNEIHVSLCTATALFVLSQDNLNTDLDEDYLKLLIKLLNTNKTVAGGDCTKTPAAEPTASNQNHLKNMHSKITEICRQMQRHGYGQYLNLDCLTPNQIAIEILLTIGGKRINEWFKNDVRHLGGLDPILSSMQNALVEVPERLQEEIGYLKSSLRFVKLLENLTYSNTENANDVYKFQDGAIVEILLKLFYKSSSELIDGSLSNGNAELTTIIALSRDLALFTLKILINLKDCYNEQVFVTKLESFNENFITHCLQFLFDDKKLMNEQKGFEINVLVLILFINLIEKNHENKLKLANGTFDGRNNLAALIDRFYFWEKCTEQAETNTKDFMSGKTTGQCLRNSTGGGESQIIEETLSQLLQRAGSHMEYTFLCAYVSILLGFMMIDDEQCSCQILDLLTNRSVRPLTQMLQKFYDFIQVAGVSHLQHMNDMYFRTTKRILAFFHECEQKQQQEAGDEPLNGGQ